MAFLNHLNLSITRLLLIALALGSVFLSLQFHFFAEKLPGGWSRFSLRKEGQQQSESVSVSVILPISGRPEHLENSLNSILRQTYKDFELLIVADGFSSDAKEIVMSHQLHDGRIRYFENPGPSGTAVRGRNIALLEARGKYIAFHDSDDVALPNRLEVSLRALESSNTDILYGAWVAFLDGTRPMDNINNNTVVDCEDTNLSKILEINPICQSTSVVRRSVFEKIGFMKPSMRYREDHEFWMRAAYFGASFTCLHAPVTNLLLHSGNTELKYEKESNKWLGVALLEYKKAGPMSLRIGFAVPGLGISGGIYVIAKHVMHLISRGHDAFFLSLSAECGSNTSTSGLAWSGLGLAPIRCSHYRNDVENIDVLIATHWLSVVPILGLEAQKKFYFVQSDERRFSNDPSYIESANKTYSQDLTFFTEAKWIQRWLKAEFGKQASYVPNGVDFSIFHSESRKPLVNRRVRVLLEGPIDIVWKGVQDAYEAVKDLEADIWIVSSSGVPPSTWRVDNFLGAVPLTKMGDVYRSVDIFVKLSRVEGFFGPPLEAMACGVAVVVGKVTGYDEYITSANAMVVEPGDIAAAKKAVESLISSPRIREKMVSEGLKTAKMWSWDSSFKHLDQLVSREFPKKPRKWL